MPFVSPFISTVSSQTGCMDTFNISASFGVITVEGGVRTCFRCLFDGTVNPSTTWTLNSMLIMPPDGTVTDGVLTIFDPTTVVPGIQPNTQLTCVAGSQEYTVFLRRRGRLGSTKICLRVCMYEETTLYIHDNLFRPDLQPPTINSTSVTTVEEGDNLTLTCNHLNSLPVTQFYWRTPNGSVINGVVNLALILPLTNILRSSSGNYTCTVQDDRNNTASSTVTIIVQCKSVIPSESAESACAVEGAG